MASADLKARFGENLSRARGRAEISQEALGLRAGLHRTEIGLLERGERSPRIETLLKLAGALSIPASDLLEGIAWSPAISPGAFTITNPESSEKR